MPQKDHGLFPLPRDFRFMQKNGFVMMIVIILIASVSSIVVITTSLSSISHLESGELFEGTLRTEYVAEGCVSEALIQLKRDANYTGGAISLGATICTITISGSGNTRSIVISGSLGNYTEEWILIVALDPFAITSWTVNS